MVEVTGALLTVPLMRRACTVMSELDTLNKVLGLTP
jgi:hypothetical protein